LILLLTLLATACHDGHGNYPARIMPAGIEHDPATLAAAEKIFQRNCASCHGKVDEGRSPRADGYYPPAPDFTEARYRHSDPAYLYWRIETGKSVEPYQSQGSVMPAWGQHFSEQQIWQLVALLKQRAEHGGNPL
jgi:mono/diheme cytochrome c family protein